MSYIGNTSVTQAFTPAVDYFSGTGSATAFTLSRPVASVAQVQVVVNNVAQNPSSAYTVSSNTITFTSAPSAGTNNIYVYYTSPITQVIQPGQNTVYPSSLSTTNALYWDTSGNVGIGTTSPSSPLNVVSATSSLAIAINGRSSDNLGAMYFYANNGSTQYSTITASATEFRLSSVPAAAVQTFYTNGSERMRLDSSGNLLFNSGYGSAATAYGCRAWVNFNGTGTVAIRASGNVTSITDNGVGDYTVNFTTAMPDANYSIVGSSGSGNAYGSYCFNNPGAGARFAVGSCRINSFISQTAALADVDTVCVSVFR